MTLNESASELLSLLIERGAVKIAKSDDDFFVFKSGRRSPNFVSLGSLTDGQALGILGRAYAQAAVRGLSEGSIAPFQYVFGPAYKGIPLATLMVESLARDFGMSVRLLYDRKEEKAHGEATNASEASRVLVGADGFKEGSGILMVDDVVTTGKAKFDGMQKLSLLGAHTLSGLVIALDRQEKMGDAQSVGERTPVQELQSQGVRTISILTMQDIFSRVRSDLSPSIRQAWIEYYKKYGSVHLV